MAWSYSNRSSIKIREKGFVHNHLRVRAELVERERIERLDILTKFIKDTCIIETALLHCTV